MAARDEPRTFLDAPVSAGTCALAIGVTGLYWAGKNIGPLTMSPEAFGREPWRLFTSALVHAHYKDSGFSGIFHILFNVAWTYRFGSALESRYGSLKTLLLFLLIAAGSSAAEFAIFEGGIGLSGVGYGLFGYLWMAQKRVRDFDEVIDRRVIVGFVAWFFFCIVATYTHMLPVANVAHGMGCLLGILAAATFTKATVAKRALAGLALAATLGAITAGATLFRPLVNIDGYASSKAQMAFDLIETDPARSVTLYREAVKNKPKNPNYCYNLGVALHRSGHADEAKPFFDKACDLANHADDRYCH